MTIAGFVQIYSMFPTLNVLLYILKLYIFCEYLGTLYVTNYIAFDDHIESLAFNYHNFFLNSLSINIMYR